MISVLGPGPRRLHRIVFLVPLAVAVLAYLPSLSGRFLSDDLLLGLLLREDGARGLVTNWEAVFADFARPWLGLEGAPLYRPLITLSYGWDLAVGGGAAWPFHLTNVVLHAASSLSAGWIASRIFRERPHVAFLATSLLFALHPVSVEAVSWISGRVSTLEVAFRLAACCGYLAWMHKERVSALVLTNLLALAALASKESAVLFFVALPMLELLADPGARWRTRWRRLGPFLWLPFAYFALRFFVLGTLIGDASPEGAQQAGLALGTLGKLAALFTPFGHLQHAPMLIASGATLWIVLLALSRASREHGRAPLLLLWALLHTLPSLGLVVTPELTGSRLLYGAVLVPALLFASVLAAPTWRRLSIPASAFAFGLVLVFADRQLAYVGAWDEVEKIQGELVAFAEASRADAPLAVTGIPSKHDGVPLINANAAFPLVQRPFHSRDLPLIGLGCVLESFRGSRALHLDGTPIAQVARAGGTVVFWSGREFVPLRWEPDRSRANEVSDEVRTLRFRRATDPSVCERSFDPPLLPLDPLLLHASANQSTAAVLDGYAPGADLPSFSLPLELKGPAPRYWNDSAGPGPRHEVRIALDRDLKVLQLHLAGGIARLVLRCEDAPRGFAWHEDTCVFVEQLQPSHLAHARRRTPREFVREIERESDFWRPGAELVLLGPHSGHRIPLGNEDAKSALDPEIAQILDNVARVSRLRSIWFYRDRTPGHPASGLRRFELLREGESR